MNIKCIGIYFWVWMWLGIYTKNRKIRIKEDLYVLSFQQLKVPRENLNLQHSNMQALYTINKRLYLQN